MLRAKNPIAHTVNEMTTTRIDGIELNDNIINNPKIFKAII